MATDERAVPAVGERQDPSTEQGRAAPREFKWTQVR